MCLVKPYYRITRPGAFIPDYVLDKRYASDRIQLSRAYISIEKSLRDIFQYIEPDESNASTFSFELFSLLLRACTEVELNCKQILVANGVSRENDYFTMRDYKKIEASSKLSGYKAIYRNWRKTIDKHIQYENKELVPFANFSRGKSPGWYSAYNRVKHNREINFKEANLNNCMNAVAGILVLLYSQFGSQCIETYGMNRMTWQVETDEDMIFDANVIFEIVPPPKSVWTENEKYKFDWNSLKNMDTPFEKFNFDEV